MESACLYGPPLPTCPVLYHSLSAATFEASLFMTLPRHHTVSQPSSYQAVEVVFLVVRPRTCPGMLEVYDRCNIHLPSCDRIKQTARKTLDSRAPVRCPKTGRFHAAKQPRLPPSTGKVKKPHRYKPGTVILREIRKCTHFPSSRFNLLLAH